MVAPVFSDQGPFRPTVRRTGRSACRRRALRGRLTWSSWKKSTQRPLTTTVFAVLSRACFKL